MPLATVSSQRAVLTMAIPVMLPNIAAALIGFVDARVVPYVYLTMA
jgi:Na+-driven multidrug efflux pump